MISLTCTMISFPCHLPHQTPLLVALLYLRNPGVHVLRMSFQCVKQPPVHLRCSRDVLMLYQSCGLLPSIWCSKCMLWWVKMLAYTLMSWSIS